MKPLRPTRYPAGLAIGLLMIVFIGLGWLLYHVPVGFKGSWGMYRDGAKTTAALLPIPQTLFPLPVQTFAWSFRGLLGTAWICWIAAVVLGFRGALPSTRRLALCAVPFLIVLAVWAPIVLSNDVFTYSGYARLFYLHEANPYLTNRSPMDPSDPARSFLLVGSPLPYGPLWLLIASRFSALGQVFGFPVEIVMHKVLAAVCLLATAWFGASLAGQREPGRGPLTFCAIAFNPLLLLEGPVTGHNDLLMMAFLVAAAARHARGGFRSAALLVGVAAAAKLTALAALPPLLYVEWTRTSSDLRASRLIWTAALATLPFLCLSTLFGGPLLLVGDAVAQSDAAGYHLPLIVQAIFAGGALVWSWTLVRRAAIPAAWLTGVIPFALAAIVMSGVAWFPWHLIWALVPALTAWDSRHRSLTVAITSAAVMLMMFYSRA